MKTFIIKANNVVQDTFIKAGLYTFNATIKSHLAVHKIGFKGASGWTNISMPIRPNKFTKASTTFELKEDVTQVNLCITGATAANPITIQLPMWTEGNNISTPSPNPADLDESTNNVEKRLNTKITQTNEKIELIATQEEFDELGEGGVTAFALIKLTADGIEQKVGKGDVISSINQSAEEIKIQASRITFKGYAEFEDAVKEISPEAITANLGISYYEFEKVDGVFTERLVVVPVNAYKGGKRISIPSESVQWVGGVGAGIFIQPSPFENEIYIRVNDDLNVGAGTIILRIPIEGELYEVDFSFKIVGRKDGKDGIDGKPGKDGTDGKPGKDGVDGKGINIKGTVNSYNELRGLTGLIAGDAYLNNADGKLYIWDGYNFPPNGQGILFQGEPGVSISSLIQQYFNHTSRTSQPSASAAWVDRMPMYEDGKYMWSRFKMTLSNGQVQYSSYSLIEDFETMIEASRVKNLVIFGDFAGEMKEILSSNPVNHYALGWLPYGIMLNNGVPSDPNNVAPKMLKINTGLPAGMLAGLRISPKSNLQGVYQTLEANVVTGEAHTFYVFARKRNASSTAQIRLKYGSASITENLTTTWARYVLRFTPTSQSPVEILFNKTGTWSSTDEVEISKIQLAQTERIFDYRPFSYVENAFAGSTSFQGGVVATRMVILSNEGGEIRSYVSGIDANPWAFAAGVTGFGTPNEKRNIGIRHDGTLYAKKAEIEGLIRTSSSGDRIEMNPNTKSLLLIGSNNKEFIGLRFGVESGIVKGVMSISGFHPTTGSETSRMTLNPYGIETRSFSGDSVGRYNNGSIYLWKQNGGAEFDISVLRAESNWNNKLYIKTTNLPTSSSGLRSGEWYRDGNYIKIV